MHTHEGACTHTTLIILMWGPLFMAVDRSWDRSWGQSSQLKKKKSYKWSPSKNTSTFPHNHREGALFWKSILFGIFLTWQPWFQSHFGYLFPEDLHANTEHPKNTVLYWKDAHKVNCSLVIPFLGSVRGTKRGDWSVKNKEPLKRQALVSHETTHFIGADFASLDIFLSCHLKCFQRSSERKTGHQEGSKAHSGWALQFQIKYHPCFPKCNLDTQNKVSSCPNFCCLEKFWGEVFHEFISARSYLLNFHLDNILGASFQSYVDVRSFRFFIFKGRENRPIRVLKWIVCSPSLSFWSNVCRRGEKSSSFLYITKWPPERKSLRTIKNNHWGLHWQSTSLGFPMGCRSGGCRQDVLNAWVSPKPQPQLFSLGCK